MAGIRLRGGLNYRGGRQRPLFTSASVAPLETVEQQRLFAWIEATARLYPEGSDERETLHWIHSIPNGAHLSKSQAVKLVAEGLTSGILDVSIDEPRGEWHGLRIEMKRKGKKPSDNQARYMTYLDRINIRRAVCYTWQAAARLIVEYLSLTVHAPVYE